MKRERRKGYALLLLGFVGAAGCFLRSIPDLTGGSEDAGLDAAAPDVEAGSACPPSKAGPLLVPVPAAVPFCIDATEITFGQYNAWTPRSLATLPPACAGKPSFTDGTSGDPRMPANVASWCDAYGFCAYAGKRLCTTAELRFACSRGGAQSWPYGNTFDKSACNGAELGLDATWPSGSHPSCEGAYAGLFDLVGNMDEWSDTCATPDDAGNGGDAMCEIFGGFYKLTGATCSPSTQQVREGSNAGFRCCAP